MIGELTLPFEDLYVDAIPDQLLMVYTPSPGSPEHDAITLLASWNANARSEAQIGLHPTQVQSGDHP